MQPKIRETVAVLACALLALSPALRADQPGAKIDPDLRQELSASPDAVAPLMVLFHDKANVKAAHGVKNKDRRNAAVVEILKRNASNSQGGAIQTLRRQGVAHVSFWVNNSIYIPSGTLALAEALARDPKVGRISREEIVQNPNPRPEAGGEITGITYGVGMINADDVWAMGHKGAGIVVANIDTGVEYTHSALVNQYRGNTGSGFSHTGNWDDPAHICSGSAPCDNNNHGTHTMGTMVGDDGVGEQIGVAPEAKWIACKGCESNSCSGSALVSCAQWVLDPLGNGGTSGAPDVVNNSWGGDSSSWYQSYVQSWRAAGIFPAFSNGNDGPGCGTAGSPGNYLQSFAAGAVSSSGAVASFSSRGPSAFTSDVKPNVAAPGVSVRSSVTGNGYAYYSGTSMASPHVAGAVALLWEARPELRGDVACTETILEQTADKVLSDTGCGGDSIADNVYGYGQLDVLDAVTLGSCGSGGSNEPPVVNITAPADLAQVDCETSISFEATASDTEDGDLASSIEWSDDNAGFGLGTPQSKSFSCTSDLGWHTIAAYVQDSNNVSDSDSIQVLVIDPNALIAATGLAASANGLDVTLTWTDTNQSESGYRVERSKVCNGRERRTNPLCDWNVAGDAQTPESFTETLPEAGSFDYRVFAFRTSPSENGPLSATVQVTASESGSGGGGGDPKPCHGKKCQ